jgi:hypothetical protein
VASSYWRVKQGEVQGWVEVKRTADEFEESITVDSGSYMHKRQARDVAYPRAGRCPHVRFANDDDNEVIMHEPDLEMEASTTEESESFTLEEEHEGGAGEGEEENQPAHEPGQTRTRKPRAKGGPRQARQVLIILRLEA